MKFKQLDILVAVFVFNNLLLHNVPLQLQIVAFALPIFILLQLFDASPLPQPNPLTTIINSNIICYAQVLTLMHISKFDVCIGSRKICKTMSFIRMFFNVSNS